MTAPTALDRLLTTYADPEWRSRYLQICDIRHFLESCILGKNYTISDELNQSIFLTKPGHELLHTLTRKHKVNAKDARMRVFLCLADHDIYVDIDKTDTDAMVAALHSQVLDGKLRVPHRIGRDLYDAAAKMFAEEHPFLSHDETIQLLDQIPIGFSQFGHWMSGPYGIIRSREARWLFPESNPPLYHCSRLTCQNVHRSQLSTDAQAGVNQAASTLSHILADRADSTSPWGQFELSISEGRYKEFSDTHSPIALPFILGECLSGNEARLLFAALLDSTNGRLRSDVEPYLGKIRAARDAASGLGTSQLLQLTLTCTNDEIQNALEGLIAEGRKKGSDGQKIVIPREEIRRPRVNAGLRFGQFELQPELGALGMRYRAARGTAHLRLHRLIDSMYRSSDDDAGEFDWQFRASAATGRARKQDEVLRMHSPRYVVENIVLSRHVNVITATEILRIKDPESLEDRELADAILWKLGYPLDIEEDVNSQFWQLHQRMEAATQTATVGVGADGASVRDKAGSYFAEVEGVIDDSLTFTTWLLLSDHLASPRPFVFRPNKDRDAALEILNAIAQDGSGENGVQYSSQNTLAPLIQGFAILAKHLSRVNDTGGELRDENRLPISPHGSNLRRYPFRHRQLFLDLTAESRSTLIQGLQTITSTLSAGSVSETRNSLLHYRRSEMDYSKLSGALTSLRSAMTTLESLGLCRILYRPTTFTTDPGERHIQKFDASQNRSISIAGPSRIDLADLPRMNEPQYLISTAELSGEGDIVRVGLQVESEYESYWQDFPSRRAPSRGTSTLGATESLAPEAVSGQTTA